MSTNILPFGTGTATPADELLSAARAGGDAAPRHAVRFATGMQPLDDVLGGGFRQQHLVLMTGRPGVGKTITALQWARACARQDHMAIYVCYEHSAQELLARLFALEIASSAPSNQMPAADDLARRAQETIMGTGSFEEVLAEPIVANAYENLKEYAQRIRFVEASGRGTDVDAIDRIVAEVDGRPVALFVDYLQKMPVRNWSGDERDRSGHLAEALKDLAISRNAAIVAITSAEREALYERRVRMHHMRGSSALVYEADVIIALNDKAVAVSRSHLAFDPVRVEQFRRQVVFSLEKNRSGPSDLDMEFTKDFVHFRLDPQGAFITEKLVDDVLYLD
jgi:replicative DNA helicase